MEAALTALSNESPDAANAEASCCVNVAVVRATNTDAVLAAPVVTAVKFACSWKAASRRRAETSTTEVMAIASGASLSVAAIEPESVAFCAGPKLAADRPPIVKLDA